MRHVRFESDLPVGEELVRMALKIFERMQTLEVGLVRIWSQEQHRHPREEEELIDIIWDDIKITSVNGSLKKMRFAGMQYDRSNRVEKLTAHPASPTLFDCFSWGEL